MIKNICLFVFLFLVAACTEKKSAEIKPDLREEMIKADKAFSELSKAEGMRKAFLEYIDSNGVLLRPDTIPLVAANAIDYIVRNNDSSFIMTWEPEGGNVAASGDLGYTYGVYSIQPKNKDTLIHGTYLSVWRKQANGKWKFVLDTGNEGIGSK